MSSDRFNPVVFVKSLPAVILNFVGGIIDAFKVKNPQQYSVIATVLGALVWLLFSVLYGDLSEGVTFLTEGVKDLLDTVMKWLAAVGLLLGAHTPQLPEVTVDAEATEVE